VKVLTKRNGEQMMDGELQWVYVIVGLVVVVSVVIPAIVQGLAQRIASGDVPKTLMGKRIRTRARP
jgi:hypothetical protein